MRVKYQGKTKTFPDRKIIATYKDQEETLFLLVAMELEKEGFCFNNQGLFATADIASHEEYKTCFLPKWKEAKAKWS